MNYDIRLYTSLFFVIGFLARLFGRFSLDNETVLLNLLNLVATSFYFFLLIKQLKEKNKEE